jgi:1,5-anhydro-D-fructose reductase (1,5-anhydro-D-mannitol-forming)
VAHEPIGVGVIGLGFMGRTHIGAYRAAADAGFSCRLVAVADADPERLTGLAPASGNFDTGAPERVFDPDDVATYRTTEELLADPSVSLVSICTYTDTHPALAIQALEAGKHVLVEKPLAVHPADADRVVAAAEAAGTICMPAMCMRFWPAWAWLKERIEDGAFGAVRSAVFQRLGSPPAWGQTFYDDTARSGGAIVDLHIHDADFVHWCFGEPEAVVSTGSLHHVTTLYRYGSHGPAHVIAEGGWDHDPGLGFRMRFVVVFEQATAEFDLGRDPQLTLCRQGEVEPVEVEPITGYDGQVRHLLRAIHDGSRDVRATPREAAAVVRMVVAERRSLTESCHCPAPFGA